MKKWLFLAGLSLCLVSLTSWAWDMGPTSFNYTVSASGTINHFGSTMSFTSGNGDNVNMNMTGGMGFPSASGGWGQPLIQPSLPGFSYPNPVTPFGSGFPTSQGSPSPLGAFGSHPWSLNMSGQGTFQGFQGSNGWNLSGTWDSLTTGSWFNSSQ
jgi:hypothetical protein